MIYEIWCFIDLAVSIEAVGEIMREVNATMKEFGFPGATYGSKFQIGTITADRELSDEELSKLKTLIGGEIMKSELHSRHGVRLDSIIKSGKPCSQPYNATSETQAR